MRVRWVYDSGIESGARVNEAVNKRLEVESSETLTVIA